MYNDDLFSLSDGTKVDSAPTFATGFEKKIIPKGTWVQFTSESAGWAEPNPTAKYAPNPKDGPRWIEVKWIVTRPEVYKGAQVTQRFKVFSPNTTTQDNSRKMLATMDTNCGGHLRALARIATDFELAKYLVNKTMTGRLDVFENDAGEQVCNWVSALKPAAEYADTAPAATKATRPAPLESLEDDNIPF